MIDFSNSGDRARFNIDDNMGAGKKASKKLILPECYGEDGKIACEQIRAYASQNNDLICNATVVDSAPGSCGSTANLIGETANGDRAATNSHTGGNDGDCPESKAASDAATAAADHQAGTAWRRLMNAISGSQ